MSQSVCSYAALRRAARRLGQLYDDVLAPSGLRATQFSLLSQIARNEGASMGTLADTMVMDRSALGHTLTPLRRAGLVALMADDQERRSKRVVLTETGRTRLMMARTMWREAQGRFDAAYGADDAASFRKMLDRVSSAAFATSFMAADRVPPVAAPLPTSVDEVT